MRGRFIIIGLLLIFLSIIQLKAQTHPNWNVDTTFYFYYPDSNAEKLIWERVNFKNSLNKREIIDSIAGYLTNTYFDPKEKNYEAKHKITIDIQNLNEINIDKRRYLIATINIKDPDRICMENYFQGSSGGRITFLMLVANFMQPQLKYPLLDAALFLYNGDELKEMDHVNFLGIISEREVDSLVRKGTKN